MTPETFTLSNLTPELEVVAPLPGSCLFAYRGSIAHGMYVPGTDPNSIDDVDLMGVVIGEQRHYFGLTEWGSRGTKEMWVDHYDIVYYEIRKMFSLLLQGNPNVLSMLWLRNQEYLLKSSVGQDIIENRNLFVGKHVYNAFAGYAYAQLEKMETRDPAELREYMAITNEMKFRGIHPNHKGEVFPDPTETEAPDEMLTGVVRDVHCWSNEKLTAKMAGYHKKGENLGYLGDKRKGLVLQHGYDSKNAAHCIRLLRMAQEFLMTGEMTVYRTSDAQELLDIKKGKWKLEDVKALAEGLFNDIKTARDASSLPAAPDRDGAEKLLIEIVGKTLSCY